MDHKYDQDSYADLTSCSIRFWIINIDNRVVDCYRLERAIVNSYNI